MRKQLRRSLVFVGVVLVLTLSETASAQARKAPAGMFKDLDDQIVGEAVVIHGKQLFIDDHLVGELKGANKVLNQPVKHPKNPLILLPWPPCPCSKAWENSRSTGLRKHISRPHFVHCDVASAP